MTDRNGCTGTGPTYTLVIACPTITVSRNGGGTFPAGTYNTAYTGQSVTVSGSNGTPYSFVVISGALPTGLSLSTAGAISGTPTATGTYSFTVQATDTFNCTGSQSFSIAIQPVATADSYSNLINNTQAVVTGGTTTSPATPFVALTGTILANDLPAGGISLTTGTFATTQAGSVTIAADGTFIYTPPVTVSALSSDTFGYTISSNTGGTPTAATATGMVTLNLSNRVWYVKNNGAAGNGQSQSPFNTLSAAITASTSNDFIFVYSGDGTSTNLSTASVLKSGQSFVGEGASLVVNGITLVPAGSFPLIGNTITLANNVTVKGIDMSTGASNGISGTGVTGISLTARNVTTTTGIAVNLTGSGNTGTMSFTSVSANGAANGINLNSFTGGSFTVTGDGGSTNNGSGGTIQNTTSHGISLSNVQNVSVDQMNIQSTGGSGINGTAVTNFSFTNGTINNSGNALGESNIAFNGNGTLSGNNINGTLTVTGSTLTNAFEHGIHAENNDGTISNAIIQNNTITSTTSTATSKGTGINLVGTGTASTVGNLTKATISGNTIRNFPSGAGIQVIYGNTSATGPAGISGTPGDATNIITITNNTVRGFDATNRFGTSAIAISTNGGNSSQRSLGNFNVSNNGTVPEPIGNSLGTVILIGNNGFATMTATVNNNVIVGNNTVASNGIGGGNGIVLSSAETPDLTLTASNNNISQIDGNGILLVGRGVTGLAKLSIKNNTVAAPLTGVRPGIRVDAGNSSSVDDAVCLDISGNTSAGSGGSQGIGLRKQGTTPTVNDFGVEGMAATSSPGVEAFVDGQNPAGGGTLLISATSGFSNCNTAP